MTPSSTPVPAASQAPAPTSSPVSGRRTHPLTPLVSGWKILAGLVAVIAAQNIALVTEEFTPQRALLALGALVVVLTIAVLASALIWWRTTYEIDATGVTLRSGLLTRRHRTAPQERIESVSVERPALARLLGLAKVRIEMAGGTDSHLDLAYVRGSEAEGLRREILRATSPAPSPVAPAAVGESDVEAREMPAQDSGEVASGLPRRRIDALRSFAYDGVTEGEVIAEVPTARLLRSMARDVSFLLGLLVGMAWVIGAIVLAVHEDGIGIGALIALAPAALTIPKMVLGRIEGGWGFVSRLTSRGLRMRRGLFSTRTDAIAPGRVQMMTLSQPLLWRGPRWVAGRALVAGIGEDDEDDGASQVLPVGTPEDLRRTLDCLLTPMGTDDDPATATALLTRPARSLDADRPVHPVFWIGRRTRACVLLPDAVAVRSGVLTRRLEIVPRERIQGVELGQGPIGRRTGSATLTLGVAGGSVDLHDLPLDRALALREALVPDAARGRLYAEQETWPRPPRPLPEEAVAA